MKITIDFIENFDSCLYLIHKSGGYKYGLGLKKDGEIVFEIPPIKRKRWLKKSNRKK